MSVVAGPCARPSFADVVVLCKCIRFVGRNAVAYFLPSMPVDLVDGGNVTWGLGPFASFGKDAKVSLAEVGFSLVGHLASPPKVNAKIVDFEEAGQRRSSREARQSRCA